MNRTAISSTTFWRQQRELFHGFPQPLPNAKYIHTRRCNVETCSEECWQPNLIRIQVSRHWSPALRPHPSGSREVITRRGLVFLHYFTLPCFSLLSDFASESAYCCPVLAPLPRFPWFKCLETLCRILQTFSSRAKANLNSAFWGFPITADTVLVICLLWSFCWGFLTIFAHPLCYS